MGQVDNRKRGGLVSGRQTGTIIPRIWGSLIKGWFAHWGAKKFVLKSLAGRAEPSRAGPSRAEPSRPETSRAEPSRAEPARAEPSRAGPSRPETSRFEPSRAKPSQAEPSRRRPTRHIFQKHNVLQRIIHFYTPFTKHKFLQ